LSLIWDVASQRLRDLPAPEVPRPPRFDGRLRREGGFVWYSELDLESLIYWRDKNAKSAEEGGKWAEANRKAADGLEKWVAWRELFPTAQWHGTRGDEKDCVGAVPARKPTVNKWPEKKEGATGTKPSGAKGRGNAPPPEDNEDSDFNNF
jgi:hypothetical protein